MRVLRLEVSVYNVYIINQFQTTFSQGGGGWVKYVSRGDFEIARRKTFVLITFKNSASVLYCTNDLSERYNFLLFALKK